MLVRALRQDDNFLCNITELLVRKTEEYRELIFQKTNPSPNASKFRNDLIYGIACLSDAMRCTMLENEPSNIPFIYEVFGEDEKRHFFKLMTYVKVSRMSFGAFLKISLIFRPHVKNCYLGYLTLKYILRITTITSSQLIERSLRPFELLAVFFKWLLLTPPKVLFSIWYIFCKMRLGRKMPNWCGMELKLLNIFWAIKILSGTSLLGVI